MLLGRVAFRILSNIHDEAVLQKYPTALKRLLFPRKSSTTNVQQNSDCTSDCQCVVWIDYKCMEFAAAGWFTVK